MSDHEIEQLINDWYRQSSQAGREPDMTPSPDCPPLALLWRHHTAGHALGQHETQLVV